MSENKGFIFYYYCCFPSMKLVPWTHLVVNLSSKFLTVGEIYLFIYFFNTSWSSHASRESGALLANLSGGGVSVVVGGWQTVACKIMRPCLLKLWHGLAM